MIYTQIEKIIEDALAESGFTFEGLKKIVETAADGEIKADDLLDVLHGMEFDDKLQVINNNIFNAYFGTDRTPVRFYLGGREGRVTAIYEGTNDGFALKEVSSDAAGLKNKENDYPILQNFTDSELKTIARMIGENSSYEDIASVLNISPSLFKRRAQFNSKTKSAIAAGRRLAENAQALKAETAHYYNLTFKGDTRAQIIHKLNLSEKEFEQKLNIYPQLREALKQGTHDYERQQEFLTAAENEPETEAAEVIVEREPEPRILSMKRLCACGSPLGARVKECRSCWLLSKGKGAVIEAETVENLQTDKRIEMFLRERNLDRDELLKITLSTIMDFPVPAIRQQFADNLFNVAQKQINQTEVQNA